MKQIQKGIESAAKGLTSITKKLEKLSQELKKKSTAKSASTRKSAPKKPAPAKSAPKKKTSAKATKQTASDTVFQIIARSNTPVDAAAIRKKTGFTTKKLQPILYRLKKQGKVKSPGKGLYEKV